MLSLDSAVLVDNMLVGDGEAHMAGWLAKQGARFPYRWQRRWFVLSRARDGRYLLVYFASDAESEPPLGSLALANASVVRLGGRRLRVLTPERELRMQAYSVYDREAWFDLLTTLLASLPKASVHSNRATCGSRQRSAASAAVAPLPDDANAWQACAWLSRRTERARRVLKAGLAGIVCLLVLLLLVGSAAAADCPEDPWPWTPRLSEQPNEASMRDAGLLVAAILSLGYLSGAAVLGGPAICLLATLAPCLHTWALAASGTGRSYCRLAAPSAPDHARSFVQLLSSSSSVGVMMLAWYPPCSAQPHLHPRSHPTLTLARYPVLMLCNLRAGTGASAHKPLDSWLVQLSMLAADGLFWLWLTLAAYAHAHPSGFTAFTPLLLEASLFAATLSAFALHYAALLHEGALHPAFAPLPLLELLVIGAVCALVGRQLLGGGDNQLLGGPSDGHAGEGTPVAELLLHLQARTHSSDSTPTHTSASPHLCTSAPPHLCTSAPPRLCTSAPPRLRASAPPHF